MTNQVGMQQLDLVLEGYRRGYITDNDLDELFPNQKVVKLTEDEIQKLKDELSKHPIFNRRDINRYKVLPFLFDDEDEDSVRTPVKRRKFELSPENTGEKVNWSSNNTPTNENLSIINVLPELESAPDSVKSEKVLPKIILNRDLEDAAIEDALKKMGTKWSRMANEYPVLKNFTGQQVKARARTIAKTRQRNGEDLGIFRMANY